MTSKLWVRTKNSGKEECDTQSSFLWSAQTDIYKKPASCNGAQHPTPSNNQLVTVFYTCLYVLLFMLPDLSLNQCYHNFQKNPRTVSTGAVLNLVLIV